MAIEEYPKVYLYKRIVQAKLFIDAHYAEAMDLDSISDEAYFSKFHFIRLFKQTYGKTPHQYLISVRIRQAFLLLQSGTSVSETCFAVGFESLSSFSGLFKRSTGISPSVFMEQQQAAKVSMKENPFRFVPSCYAHQHGWIKNSNFEEAKS